MHEKATGLPASEFMRGVALFNAGRCEERQLRNGEELWNTFTNRGRSASVKVRVNFKFAPDDERRRAAVCDLGRPDGAVVVFPYVCGNWSVMYINRPVAMSPAIPTSRGRMQCDLVETSRTTHQSQSTLIPGSVVQSGCCNCTVTTFIPPLMVGGGNQSTSSTSQQRCVWIEEKGN
jgi:hypothetical protein